MRTRTLITTTRVETRQRQAFQDCWIGSSTLSTWTPAGLFSRKRSASLALNSARLITLRMRQLQNSTFAGGAVDDLAEQYYLLGINLKYLITPHFSAELGYNYDKLESDIANRSFDRNRVYIGVAATY